MAPVLGPFSLDRVVLAVELVRQRLLRAMSAAGFIYRHVASIDLFLDGPEGKARDGVRLIFDGEMVQPGELVPNPAVTESVPGGEYQVLSLRALVQIKLTAYGDKDRTHLRDLLEVGLIDSTWLQFYPAELGDRLRILIETPGG